MGGVVYMSWYTKLFRGGCIHNGGYLKGAAAQPPSNRQVMDKATSKHLRTGTYKLPELGTRSLFPGLLSALRSFFIHGLLSLYRSFCRFSGSLIAQSLSKKPVVRSWKRALKRKIAPKTTTIRSYVCIIKK